jgi:hypothetical protein
MRLGAVLLAVSCLAAAAVLPGLALAQEEHHHAEGPANPMVKQALLFLDAAGGLSPTAVQNTSVPAGPSSPDGASTPVSWTITATKHTKLDSSVFVDIFATVNAPTIVAGGPDGAAFLVQLTLNGEPVEGASSAQRLDSGVLRPGDTPRIKLFIPQPQGFELNPGDELGVLVRYYGVNLADHEAVSYNVGGEQGSRIGFRLRMADLAQLDIPKEVGSWPVAPLEGFDFDAAARKNPGAKVATLRAHQYGFGGAPVTVKNGTQVILQMLVDETLSTSGEGHEGHGHDAGNASWDQNIVTALHGFSLAALDGKLQTVLFDGLVVTMTFDADKPGNYTFFCTVYCGTGHGGMLDRLTIEGVAGPLGADGEPLQNNTTTLGPQEAGNKTPGVALPLLAAGAVAAALLARRRKA